MLLLLQVVIVVEGTRGIDFLFGIIIAVVCANWIAQFVHKDGVYESELDHDGNVFFLRTEAPNALQYKTASDVSACLLISQLPLLGLLLRLSCSFSLSFSLSFVHSFVRSFIHSLIHSFIHSFIYSAVTCLVSTNLALGEHRYLLNE